MADLPFIVTIDGPAGVGKSTLAKRVAQALSIAYLDTGAMFRTIALMAEGLERHNSGTPLSGPEIVDNLSSVTFRLEGAGETTRLICNGRMVGQEVRTEKAGMLAARVAALPEVRELLKSAQQRLGAVCSLVAEGRDMGTVVFPHAACKIFLDADVEVRAQRRFLQLEQMGQPADLATIAAQIRERDEKDRNRTVAPLKAADDAVIIDTSAKSLEEVFEAVMEAVQSRKS